MTGVGFEPTRTNTSELESDPLDHSGKHARYAAILRRRRHRQYYGQRQRNIEGTRRHSL